ncbi:MAG: Gfo/Idh/MocA family oxidoreductase, partial [Chthoniobacterales bacterium]
MKLGIIGLGMRMTHMLNKAFRPNAEDLRVVGVIEPNPERIKEALTPEEQSEVGVYDTVESLVAGARPDALLIGTRCNLHARYACEAAATGLPIYLEKPIATSMQQALDIAAAFKKSTSPVVVSFPLRTSTMFQEVNALVQSRDFGRPEHILAVNYVPYGNVYFDMWYRDYSITQGLFLQKATHDFDYLSVLAGAPIVRVAAMLSQGRVFRDSTTRPKDAATDEETAVYYDDIGTPETGMNEDSSSALLEFANGVKGVYTQVFFSKGAAETRGATLSNYRGTVSFDWYRNTIRHVPHLGGEARQWEVGEAGNHFGGDDVLARNFFEVIKGQAASLCPIETGLQSVFACLAAKESAATGR